MVHAVFVTHHAAQRYVERVAPHLTETQAIGEIRQHERAILAAARFGCRTVRLGTGVRFVLEGTNVVTVTRRQEKNRGIEHPRRGHE